MPNYYLIQFDGELMFHNDRQMTKLIKFRNFMDKKECALALIQNKKLIKEYFIDDDGDCIRFPFHYDMSDGNFSEDLLKQNLEYYSANPKKFLKDVKKTWQNREIDAFAIVNENSTLFKILANGKCFDSEPVRVIKKN